MLINADFSRAAVVTPDQYDWTASPQQGVERVMLDRIGAEQARATSIVRFAPDSVFPLHGHPAGEEFFVLSGTFSDESGSFPAGWYVRNPPGSPHAPWSREGAILFVKLRQMTEGNDHPVRVDTRQPSSWRQWGDRAVCPLFTGSGEEVCLQRVAPHAVLFAEPIHGAELLVLEGELVVEGQACTHGAWIRLPAGAYPTLVSGAAGAMFYLKTGHLTGSVTP